MRTRTFGLEELSGRIVKKVVPPYRGFGKAHTGGEEKKEKRFRSVEQALVRGAQEECGAGRSGSHTMAGGEHAA